MRLSALLAVGCGVCVASDSFDPSVVISTITRADMSKVLLYQKPDLSWDKSTVYLQPDMVKAVTDMYKTGVGDKKLWLGDNGPSDTKYGLTSVAAFLAQCMQETIRYNVCDENNWDQTSGYAASNACGQLGQNYQGYTCAPGEEHMQCPVDKNMKIRASTSATWYGAPAPMFCAPKTSLAGSPKWSLAGAWCDSSPHNPNFTSVDEYIQYFQNGGICRDYPGQKDGHWVSCPGGCPNNNGPNKRVDVEGCCWWGRGVIQSTGICNYGKLNYYIGAGAQGRTGTALFPDVDFCKHPEAVCANPKYPELKWISGLFFWMMELQTYNRGGWEYFTELKKFVDAGFPNPGSDMGFIHGVSGIVNRGCHNPPCGTGELDAGAQRAANFQTVLHAFGLI